MPACSSAAKGCEDSSGETARGSDDRDPGFGYDISVSVDNQPKPRFLHTNEHE